MHQVSFTLFCKTVVQNIFLHKIMLEVNDIDHVTNYLASHDIQIITTKKHILLMLNWLLPLSFKLVQDEP